MAARFVFSLQPLLEERRRREECNRQAFARAKRAREEALREMARLNGSLRQAGIALYGCALSGEFAGGGVRFYDARLRFLAEAIEGQSERVARWGCDASLALAELTSAHRERLAVEKLRERRLREFRAEEARRDEMEIDEANSRLHALRQAQDDTGKLAQDDTGKCRAWDGAIR
ncbi:MAG TPA: flagellar export protein FliJ [Candidatus Cybelea sp.]|jgi:flagellar export protein FliJ|nr:flagellar export protein FliJ [Candidatus Cybelea sp.]